MAFLFWDASALVKRYYPEIGSEMVDLLIADTADHSMACTALGYIETYSILLRRFNGGIIDLGAFTDAVNALQAEVVQNPGFHVLSITDTHVFSSIETMRRHNLNATDAVLLTVLLEYARLPSAPSCLLIASDHRFLRAAAAEGLRTINPEAVAAADVIRLLSSL